MKRFPYHCWLLALFFAFAAGVLPGSGPPPAAAATGSNAINAVTLAEEGEELRLRIMGSTPPTFTAYELFDPPRLIIDIADAHLAEKLVLPADLSSGPLRQVRGRNLTEHQPAIVRLELHLSGDPAYDTNRRDHEIVVAFSTEPANSIPTQTVADGSGKQKPTTAVGRSDGGSPATISPGPDRPGTPGRIEEAVTPLLPSLAWHRTARPTGGGSTAKPMAEPEGVPAPLRQTTSPTAVPPVSNMILEPPSQISVEFFKSDLHNVFRFFGEISERNIVVDEAVRGELTLTLRDVPWDFALDIVLNLKDLQKEERHNTIVISPRAKAFVWPERASDQLTVRADGTLAQQPDALSVRQRLDIPPERLAARDLLREGAKLEQRGEHQRALAAYEQALTLWPENSELAERMALLNLLHLGNNARALHFAATALRHNGENDRAALLAAVAAAGMERAGEAKSYFDQAINHPRPAAEALISYAAFAEEYDSPHGALALLERHRQLYGDTLETMVGKARLYDKTGAAAAARAEYRALLYSGYELPEDLQRYIQTRIASERE